MNVSRFDPGALSLSPPSSLLCLIRDDCDVRVMWLGIVRCGWLISGVVVMMMWDSYFPFDVFFNSIKRLLRIPLSSLSSWIQTATTVPLSTQHSGHRG